MGARRVLAVLAALLIAAAATGCGSARPAAPRTASQILSAAIAAIDGVSSFRMHATGRDGHGMPVVFDAQFVLPGRMTVTITTGGQTASMVVLGQAVYISGNARYWASQRLTAGVARLLSDRWLKLSAARLPSLRGLRAFTQASTLGRCLLRVPGTITVASRTVKVDGVPATVIRDAGDRPGDPPSRLYLAASGPPLPLRMVQTGPGLPGGHPDPACGHSSGPGSITIHEVRMSDYNVAGQIFAPSPVINLRHALASQIAKVKRSLPASRPTSPLERAQAAAITGTWLSRGHVVAAHGPIDEAAGPAILARVWRIGRYCAGGVCSLAIARTVTQGATAARLRWTGHGWTAHFVQGILCTSAGISAGAVLLYSDWVLTLRAGRLSAVEHNRTGTDCGRVGTSTLVWTAQRALSPPGPRTLS